MNIGIDARALTEKKTGIGMYVYENIKRLNEIDKINNYFLYSNKTIVIDFKLNENWHIKEFKSKIGTFFAYFKLPSILKKDRVDVFWGTEHCLPRRNKYTKDIKFVLTIYDLAIEKIKKVGSLKNQIVQKLILKKSCLNANKIITVSKSTKKDMIEILKIEEDKIVVIYPGVSQNKDDMLSKKEADEISKKYKIQNSKFIFFLSTIEPRKNLNTAIKAFEEYKKILNDDLKFIISGGIGWRCNDTLKLISKSKYNKDIIQTGYIDSKEKAYFFSKCEAFIYPSLYEGFGLPILEAMQRGTLVVTTYVSSIPEVAGNAALYLHNVMNVEELRDIFIKVVNMGVKDKINYIENGYIQAQKFHWENSAKEILKVMIEGKE